MDRGARAEGGAPLKLIALGDSLTAGYGLPAAAAFPSVLEKRLREEGYNLTIVNAGVSGDTASGGLTRIDWTLHGGADGVIVELGANDMLRGIDPGVTRSALDGICAKIAARNIKILIAGMKATPSLGADYQARFDSIYPELARKYHAPLYPFFLDGVAGHPALLLEDHLHPSPEGVRRIVEGILPLVHSFLRAEPAETPANPKE
ncbi:MAG TPA: arylesterase [Methylocella sp.]|nr:arylesterase [Methylocella sp.]